MKKMMKQYITFLSATLIIFLANAINSVYAASPQSVQEAILGQNVFTQTELIEMDLNQDNIVDVADLVALIFQQSQQVSFATTSSEMDETTDTHYIIVDFTGSTSEVLNYALGGTAALNEDYTDLTNSSVPIINSKAIIKLSALSDTNFEGNETILLTLLPSNDFQLGAQRTHTVTLNDNPNETQADYLFTLGSHVPGTSSPNQPGLAPALLSRTASVALTFSQNTIIAAHLNEDKSIGIADKDMNSNTIPAKSISYDSSTGGLEILFEYQSESDSFGSGASIGSFQFDPDNEALPTFDGAAKKQMINKLTLLVNNFDIATEKLTDKLLQGSFSLDTTGVLSDGTMSASTGTLVGTMQQ